jgi:membrane protease YdiL (CAAX protease family)
MRNSRSPEGAIAVTTIESAAMKGRPVTVRIFFLALLTVLVGEIAVVAFISHTAFQSLVILGVERFTVCAVLLMLVAASDYGLAIFDASRAGVVGGIKKGLVWSACCGVAAALVFALLYAMRISPLTLIRTSLPAGRLGLVVFFLVGGLIAPVAEEVFFRGIVYGFLRKWGAMLAIIGSTVVFAGAHAFLTPVPLIQIMGGILFAIAYEVEGNLLVPVVIHILGNTTIFSLSLMGDY